MRLLALDPSTTALGWAVVELEGFSLEYAASGVYKPPGEWWERVDNIWHTVEWLTDYYKVEAVAYEIPTGDHRNMEVNRRMGAAEYAVVHAAHLHVNMVTGVPASSVVNHDLGKRSPGHARKFAALTGKEPESDDECDALACAFVAADKMWSEGVMP